LSVPWRTSKKKKKTRGLQANHEVRERRGRKRVLAGLQKRRKRKAMNRQHTSPCRRRKKKNTGRSVAAYRWGGGESEPVLPPSPTRRKKKNMCATGWCAERKKGKKVKKSHPQAASTAMEKRERVSGICKKRKKKQPDDRHLLCGRRGEKGKGPFDAVWKEQRKGGGRAARPCRGPKGGRRKAQPLDRFARPKKRKREPVRQHSHAAKKGGEKKKRKELLFPLSERKKRENAPPPCCIGRNQRASNRQ